MLYQFNANWISCNASLLYAVCHRVILIYISLFPNCVKQKKLNTMAKVPMYSINQLMEKLSDTTDDS